MDGSVCDCIYTNNKHLNYEQELKTLENSHLLIEAAAKFNCVANISDN